ncbi:MAG: serine hydrolase [Kordiimonadaceae bacterium]|jgi:CubicO group peptidase (beta-lactamase class C family)|nr:serine hydrolase [Kordiimonadaceae bacterium]MBT6030943.1 serine hydrolase [Kordiimonadaceae bacterium]
MNYLKFALLCMVLVGVNTSHAKNISERQIDRIVENAMKVFSVPGMGIGVIIDGKVRHAKGYGVRSLSRNDKVDTKTYFGIASNSKGFTATALGLLVEDGIIKWDDKVKDHLPDFQLSDPWITDHFTIADLLSHHSGLPLGSGDLMWWPDSNYQPDEIIKKMRFLKPDREFRTTYAYNNLPFIVAGAIIPAVTGKSYHQFLQDRIFDHLNMTHCTANTPMMAANDNIAEPHAVLDGKLKQVKRYLTIEQVPGSIAAAGIQCSVDDLLKWEMMHLNHGKGLMSKAAHDQLWQVNTAMNVTDNHIQNGITYRGYGLGFTLNDYHGQQIISHGGALIGMYSHLTMVPELGFAIAIISNQQSSSANNHIKNQILDQIMNVSGRATAKQIYKAGEKRQKQEVSRLKKLKSSIFTIISPDNYIGIYTDPFWDDVTISKNTNGLYFTSSRSPSLKGSLEHYKNNTYIVRWDDRTHEADAYVMFENDATGKVKSFTMKAISIRTDFSYDFHHLNMIKQ